MNFQLKSNTIIASHFALLFQWQGLIGNCSAMKLKARILSQVENEKNLFAARAAQSTDLRKCDQFVLYLGFLHLHQFVR